MSEQPEFMPVGGPGEEDESTQSAQITLDLLGGGQAEQPFAVAAPRKSIPSGVLFLGFALVVGGGALLAMRHFGVQPGSAVAGSAVKIEYDVYARKAQPSGDHERLLADLNASPVAVQVPAAEVQKNPFLLDPAPRDAVEVDTGGEDRLLAEAERRRLDAERQRLADRERAVQNALGRLQLNGTMLGSRPIARINGGLVTLGDRTGDDVEFTVVEIRDRAVVLEVGGDRYLLSMDPIDKPRR